jgi:hypothetical protein
MQFLYSIFSLSVVEKRWIYFLYSGTRTWTTLGNTEATHRKLAQAHTQFSCLWIQAMGAPVFKTPSILMEMEGRGMVNG